MCRLHFGLVIRLGPSWAVGTNGVFRAFRGIAGILRSVLDALGGTAALRQAFDTQDETVIVDLLQDPALDPCAKSFPEAVVRVLQMLEIKWYLPPCAARPPGRWRHVFASIWGPAM